MVLQAASGWPAGTLIRDQFERMAELVAEGSNGELTIEIVGPEAWPPPEQIAALSDGAFDIVSTTSAYYVQDLPAGSIASLTRGSREELESAGVYDLVEEAHQERYGVTTLAVFPLDPMHLFVKEPVERVEDLSGLRVRSPPLFSPGLDAIGMTTTFMSDAETVDGLRQGSLDAAMTTVSVYTTAGYTEAAKYVVYPAITRAPTFVFMNQAALAALPEHLQQLLRDIAPRAEEEAGRILDEEAAARADAWRDARVEEIVLPREQWEDFVGPISERYYSQMVEPNEPPERAQRIRELLDELAAPTEDEGALLLE
ncbi:TRAP transporter substrate-binding protein [Nitriliruptor alkaliphilus]|uniref:TRAP transporter substrate-binding protein n=1 Tax=Nitriliruptor alkaliphilus TaxID=427918 RepID=UPI001470155D|nr:TRAP transporter substrate-binding protein DctP [Nitriliruptor alkaliphilus]